jgi:hypothetical protein
VNPLTWPKWALYVAFGFFVLIGGTGTCIKFSSSSNPVPVPTPNKVLAVWDNLPVPTSNTVNGLKLPSPIEINASQRYIIIAADCPNEVRWLVSNQNPLAKIEVLECKLINSIMIFPDMFNQPDVIVVIAYTTNESKPTSPAITAIKVKSSGPKPPPIPVPTPDPTPTPTPLPTVSSVHVTFILDYNKMTRSISDITNSKELRDFIKEGNNEVHELSTRDDLEGLGLKKYIGNTLPPMVVIQDQKGNVLNVSSLASIQQVKDLINKATGK